MKKLRVGVLFGGRSGEHEVSLLSAASVLNAIDKKKYEVVPIGITKEGRWVTPSHAERLLKGEGRQRCRADVHLRAGIPKRPRQPRCWPRAKAWSCRRFRAPTILRWCRLRPTRTRCRPLQIPIDVDIIFPVLHGTFGEDGTIQGLLELADIAYVGAGVLGSAAGMDKDVMKRLFRDAGLPIVKHVTVLRSAWRKRAEESSQAD